MSGGFASRGIHFERVRSAWVRFGRIRFERIRVQSFLFEGDSFREDSVCKGSVRKEPFREDSCRELSRRGGFTCRSLITRHHNTDQNQVGDLRAVHFGSERELDFGWI